LDNTSAENRSWIVTRYKKMRSVAKISQPYSSKPRGKVATIPRLFPFACYTKCEGTVAVSVVATVKLIPITLVNVP
jgi:hypothetical protein